MFGVYKMDEYNLKKSKTTIGQLYPILEDKHGNIIDGFHRAEADPTWKRMKLDHIDSEEKMILARAISNWHRRQVSREEKAEWINGLAKIYQKQGLKVGKDRERNEVINKLIGVLGLSRETIIKYLEDEFRQERVGGVPKGAEFVLASQRIETALGQKYVKRHREELLADPEFRSEAIRKEIQEDYKKRVEKGTTLILDIEKVKSESQEIIEEMVKVHTITNAWGINHYMILKNDRRLKEADSWLSKIQRNLMDFWSFNISEAIDV